MEDPDVRFLRWLLAGTSMTTGAGVFIVMIFLAFRLVVRFV